MRGGNSELQSFERTKILGWSASRYDKFSMCRRQYYYSYYRWNEPPALRSRADYLASLTSVPLETGNIVHDTIKTLLERLLKTEKPVDRKQFFEFAGRKTEEYCRKNFMEVHYKEKPEVDRKEILEKVRHNLSEFLNSKRYEWIILKALFNKNKWLIEPPGFGETRIDGWKAYCKVDFLFPVGNEIYILDWKTGRKDERKHSRQLLGYFSWASYHFGRSAEEIIPIIAYLSPEYSELKIKFNEFDIQEFKSGVVKETKEMYAMCRDAELNAPRDKEEFQMTESRKLCSFCNFRELCGR
jgi:hypothetical protein